MKSSGMELLPCDNRPLRYSFGINVQFGPGGLTAVTIDSKVVVVGESFEANLSVVL